MSAPQKGQEMVPKTSVILSKEEYAKRKAKEYRMTLEQWRSVFYLETCNCVDRYCPGWVIKLKALKGTPAENNAKGG